MPRAARDPVSRALPRHVSLERVSLLAMLLLGTLLGWAALTEVEIVVMAPAAARAVGGNAELRAPDSRPIARVLVEEGQRVARGAPIVRLDSRLLHAQREAARRAALEQRRNLAAIDEALRALADATPLDALEPRARLQVLSHRSRLAELDAAIRALVAEREAARARTAAAERLLAIARERYAAAQTAAREQAISRFELLAARQDLLGQQAAAEAAAGAEAALQQRLGAERAVRAALAADLRQALLERRSALDLERLELETRAAEAAERLRLAEVRAPMAGIVDRLAVSEGDFVERGEPLGVIVPDGATVRFEARILPSQAAFLRAGQPCRLKLDALPFARYGALPCVLERLSRDVVPGESGTGHYLAEVRPLAERLAAGGQPLELRPGATAWLDVVTGRRTVLSFLTDPLTRFTHETLRER
ncbi:MAG TPA: HlyD family efflux transporter periplasmic adaptor subunit [Pseudomonadales bacterium]